MERERERKRDIFRKWVIEKYQVKGKQVTCEQQIVYVILQFKVDLLDHKNHACGNLHRLGTRQGNNTEPQLLNFSLFFFHSCDGC